MHLHLYFYKWRKNKSELNADNLKSQRLKYQTDSPHGGWHWHLAETIINDRGNSPASQALIIYRNRGSEREKAGVGGGGLASENGTSGKFSWLVSFLMGWKSCVVELAANPIATPAEFSRNIPQLRDQICPIMFVNEMASLCVSRYFPKETRQKLKSVSK